MDYREVAVGNAKRFVGRGELDTVAYGELAVDLSIDTDACETTGIVGGKFSVRFLDREQVCAWPDCDDRGVGRREPHEPFLSSSCWADSCARVQSPLASHHSPPRASVSSAGDSVAVSD